MAAAVIEVRHLTKIYEPSPLWLRFLLRTAITSPVTALDDLSLEMWPGEICAVVGPNGAGKSTLFRILTGLTTPTSGVATVMGHDSTRESYEVRKLIGFMPAGDQTIYLRHSCRENLLFHGRLQKMRESTLRQRLAEVLELVGLTEAADRVGFALSAGMRARLSLARSLLHRPPVLVLDEPTGAVDPVGSYELLQTIQQVAKEENVSVLLSSHRLEEIEALHDHVVLLDRGRLLHSGNLASLRQRSELPQIELLFADDELAASALDVLHHNELVEIVRAGPRSLNVVTGIGTGPLLAQLNGQLSGLVSVRETRLPLRDLLAGIFATSRADFDRGDRS